MNFPLLLIGQETLPAFNAEHQGFKSYILEVSNVDLVLEELSMAKPRDILLMDLAALPRSSRALLLKFVEEYRGRVAIFSTDDLFDSVILSRFKDVRKSVPQPEFKPTEIESTVNGNPNLFNVYMNSSWITRRMLKAWRS